jgi:hypothetical protein
MDMTCKLEWKPTEIADAPEVLRLAEDVRATEEPRLLQRDGEAVAVLLPVALAEAFGLHGPRTEADRQAFLSSAGGWRGIVDVEKVLDDLSESRGRPMRPPVER